jgi:hypothetical protein
LELCSLQNSQLLLLLLLLLLLSLGSPPGHGWGTLQPAKFSTAAAAAAADAVTRLTIRS